MPACSVRRSSAACSPGCRSAAAISPTCCCAGRTLGPRPRGREAARGRSVRVDLKGVDLRRADLTNARLRNAILDGADLRDAILDGVALDEADIRGARLDLAGAAQLARGLGADVM